MPRKENETSVSVGLVVVPETAPAVLYGCHEVFSAVGSAWQELTGRPAGRVRMRPHMVAASTAQTACAGGAPVVPDASFASANAYDIAIATDLALTPVFEPRGRWGEAAAWVRRQYEQGALVASVCTGSVLLAEAGLLDGVEATTHWGAVSFFRNFYPRVRLTPEKVLALAGPEQRIVTAGGYAAWTDLALYLIARFFGQEEAVCTAKVFLLGDRSEGQKPFAAMTRPRGHGDAVIEACQVWIAEHYALPNPVARMVEYSGMAARTFKRRFRAATGFTPIEYVQSLRVEEAKHLLEMTSMAVDAVGACVGYEDPASFRRIFKRLAGINPGRYRQRVRGVVPLRGRS